MPKAEISTVLRALGHNMQGPELDALNIPAKCSLADFEKIMAGLTNTTPTAEIVNAFKVFDKQADGTVNRDELQSALCSMGDKLTNDQVDEMLEGVASDDNGNFKYKDFVAKFRSDA